MTYIPQQISLGPQSVRSSHAIVVAPVHAPAPSGLHVKVGLFCARFAQHTWLVASHVTVWPFASPQLIVWVGGGVGGGGVEESVPESFFVVVPPSFVVVPDDPELEDDVEPELDEELDDVVPGSPLDEGCVPVSPAAAKSSVESAPPQATATATKGRTAGRTRKRAFIAITETLPPLGRLSSDRTHLFDPTRFCFRHAARPMALDPDFVADCPYGPGGLLLDEILKVDEKESLVVARMPTDVDLPLTREQRNHPVLHPPHVSGGLMVHMTGMVGFAHAYYVLKLRHADGWIGYGARINSARFHALASPGAPIVIECKATQVRRGSTNVLARYAFRFRQNDTLVYEGDQTALWLDATKRPPTPPAL